MAQDDTGDAGALPMGWMWTTLEKICKVNPKTTRPEDFSNETPVSFIPMASVDEASGSIVTPETRPVGEVWKSYKRFAENDVVFAKITPCMENGKAAIARRLVNGLGLGSTEFHVLRSSVAVIPEWVYHFVRQESFRAHAAAEMTGTAGQLRVPAKYLEGARIPLAPLPEQHRIVAEIETQFTRLEAGVTALKRAQANLRRYRAAVLKAACEGRLLPGDEVRAIRVSPDYVPADALLQRILAERRAKWEADNPGKKYQAPAPPDASDLPALPEGWIVASMDQLTTLITSGPRHWSRYYREGSGTFLMAQNIRPGQLDLSYRQPVNPPEDDSSRERSQVEAGDLLVTIVGANTGDVCQVPHELPEHYVCQSVALVRFVDRDLSDFVTLYMVSPENGQRQYQRYIYGAGRPHLKFDELRMTAVLLPPLAEQRHIVAEVERRLSVVTELEKQVEAALRRADRLRQAILKRAFEGRLVPQDPADEPAPALLARIQTAREQGGNQIRKPVPAQLHLPAMQGERNRPWPDKAK